MSDLPIINKTYELIKWYVPILNRMPKDHKFGIADRIINRLYDLLEGLSEARYDSEKLQKLKRLNAKIDILRLFSRLLHDFNLFDDKRSEYVGKQINEIGRDLGGWIKQQQTDKDNQ